LTASRGCIHQTLTSQAVDPTILEGAAALTKKGVPMEDIQQQKQFLRRALVLKIMRRTLALVTLACMIYGLVALVYATKTIYKVKMNYAVVLERFGGIREAVTDVGWHVRLPFFTRIEQEVSLMNHACSWGDRLEPMRIISKGNVALWTSAVLTYRIRDLRTWAIENLDPHEPAARRLRRHCQGHPPGPGGRQSRDRAAKRSRSIFEALKASPINVGGPTLEEKYGIEIVSFVLKETRFGDKLVEATEEKKRAN
jgi:regulator of protease activity HflC (stomatin/prohibitin superfamily)